MASMLSVADALFQTTPRSMACISADEAWDMNSAGYVADLMSYEDFLLAEREFASANGQLTVDKLTELRLLELTLPKRERRIL